MKILTVSLLIIAGLCTMLMVPVVVDLRRVSGADAMGLLTVFAVMAPRFAALAAAIAIAAARGGFPWLGTSRGVQAALGLGFHTLAGLASLASVAAAVGPDSEAVKAWAYVFAIGFPAATIVAVAMTLGREPASIPAVAWRGAGIVLVAVLGAGGWTMWRVDQARQTDTEAQVAAMQAERDQVHARRLAALAAMSPQAPLGAWLPWIDSSDDEVRTRALDAVRARPALGAELAEMLRGPEAVRALRFIWLWMPDARPELADPVRDAFAAMPVWAEHVLDSPPSPGQARDEEQAPPEPRVIDLSSACESAVAVATYYRNSGVDFSPAFTELLTRLEARALPAEQYAEDPTRDCRDFLRVWLDTHRK